MSTHNFGKGYITPRKRHKTKEYDIERRFVLEFDGVDDYATVGDKESLEISTSNITVSGWAKLNSIQNASYPSLVKKNENYNLWFDHTTGVLKFKIVNSDSSQNTAAGAINYFDDNWHFFLGTYDHSNIKIYVDGIYINSAILTGDIKTDSTALTIGGTSNAYLNSLIADVRIYNRALSSQEVASLYGGAQIQAGLVLYHNYRKGNANDISGNGNNGVVSGAVFKEVSF